jgi:DNA polymerase-3 subunit gamma/tau
MCKEITAGSALDVFEIDAASHTGVDNVREIIDGVRFAPNKGKFKVYIIDEVHMLSTAAFNALLKTLEEPPAHAVFILATTEIHKVPATVASRCQRFDFRRFTPAEIVERLKTIIKAEKIKVSDDVLFEIARHAEGCERDAESLLGQLLALGEKEIDLNTASLVLPVAFSGTVIDFVEKVIAAKAPEAIRILNEGVEQGMDIPTFLDNVVALLRTILFIKLGGLERFQDSYEIGVLNRLSTLSGQQTLVYFSQAIDLFLLARRSVKGESIPQLGTELAVIKITFPAARNTTNNQQNEQFGGFLVDFSQTSLSEKPNKMTNIIEKPEIVSELPTRTVAFDEAREKWNDLCGRLQEKSPSLSLVLKNGNLTKISGNQIGVSFDFLLHAETVNRPKNKKIIDETFSEILGTLVSVSAIHVPPMSAVDETIGVLTEAFGGQTI